MRATIGLASGFAVGIALAAVRHGSTWGSQGYILAGAACGIVYLLLTRPRKAK